MTVITSILIMVSSIQHILIDSNVKSTSLNYNVIVNDGHPSKYICSLFVLVIVGACVTVVQHHHIIVIAIDYSTGL